MIFKSFCRAILAIRNYDLEIPLPKANQEIRGLIADARVNLRTPRLRGELAVEIKLSYLHYHKTAGDNWAFTYIFKTANDIPKSRFDLLFCIGLPTRSPSDENYWHHRKSLLQTLNTKQTKALKAKPYESDYLSLCSFFIMPFDEIPKSRGYKSNHYQPYKRTFHKKPGYEFFTEGVNRNCCRKIWWEAAEIAISAKRSRKRFSYSLEL